MRSVLSVALFVAAVLLLVADSSGFPGDKPESIALDLTGTLGSKQVDKEKDGSLVTVTVFYLDTGSKKIVLPQPRAKKGESPPFDLADYVGAKVKVSAKGFQKPTKNGGIATYVREILSIQRV